MAKAAKFFKVNVFNASLRRGFAEGFLVELRIETRARDGAYIDEASDAVFFEQGEELVDGARGVADGEDVRHVRIVTHR